MAGVLERCEKFLTARDRGQLCELFSAEAEQLGFTWFAYLGMRLQGRSTLDWHSTYPADWTSRYLEQRYQEIDPCVAHSGSSMAPLVWGGREGRSKLRGKRREMFLEAHDWGIQTGVTVPVHVPNAGWGAVTVASQQGDAAFMAAVKQNIPTFQFLSLQYHEAMARLQTVEKPGRRSLTPRELECLRWTAIGKSAWETAELLHISQRTVVDYLESAKRKLGVYSKTHAVVTAIMEGLIVP